MDLSNREQLKENYIAEYLHPHVQRSLKIIKKYFTEIFNEQKPLEVEKGQEIVGKILTARSA